MSDTKELLEKALRGTRRKGISKLISAMDVWGFWDAPASGGNHEHVPGGLAEHTLHVYQNAIKLARMWLSPEQYKALKPSITISSILHDLGKCGDYNKQLYIPNMIKDGRPTKADPVQRYKQSDNKPYKRNPELSNVPHAVRSIKLAQQFIVLTEDEEWAMLCHDGLYDFMKYEIPGHETPLLLIIHDADMWATNVDEKEGDD